MQVTALDEADKKVDWFFIYKVPQLPEDGAFAKAAVDRNGCGQMGRVLVPALEWR